MVAEDTFHFRSSRGRADRNPYVDRIKDFGSHALRAEESEPLRGHWREAIGKSADAPLLLEIGPGNGFFFAELARRHPEAAVVAVEIRFKRVWLTAKKALEAGAHNFRVIHHHSRHLPDLFEDGELDAVFIHHPDPWPKERHHKHRLLQPSFANQLARLLRTNGEVWLKSDFEPYGPLAREVFSGSDFSEIEYTADLHGRPSLEAPEDVVARFRMADVATNYEVKSRKKGARIMLAGYRRQPVS
ncbi:MAG TPA: tRNA (guanosine(46)-N7)-methyltransferase TrmB [Deltaproteobacteria bacterium]|nr:tRNA (guanosine(46)-N7)-methyltransferase TrmB [Deltaproteobacteria bacterium]